MKGKQEISFFSVLTKNFKCPICLKILLPKRGKRFEH